MSSKLTTPFETILHAAKDIEQLLRSGEPLFRNCVNCDNLIEGDICRLANKRPPAKIIVVGCEKYININEHIPF